MKKFKDKGALNVEPLLKRKKKTKEIKSWIFLILICISTLFMSVGYAKINSIKMNIEGTLIAEAQDGVFITDIVYANTDSTNSTIKSYYQTLLESKIELEKEITSTVTYTITIYNKSGVDQYFKEAIYNEENYDNSDIIFSLENLEYADKLVNNGYVTFNITFKYDEGLATIENNILNSFIKFVFVPSTEVTRVTIANNGEKINQLVDLEIGETTFSDVTMLDGVVARCNNSTVPTLNNNVLTISNITSETECGIFDTLEEAVETSDTTVNNMLMIANEDMAFTNNNNITVSVGKNINLDINGKIINASTNTATVGYIENKGILKISNSKEGGYIQTNYRVIANVENGELTIDSGTYKRTETDYVGGGVIINYSGKVILKNSTFTSAKTTTFLNYGDAKSVTLIDNCIISSTTGDTIINASADSEISISNSTISTGSGAAFKGAYNLSGSSTNVCGPTYICNSTVSANYDYYVTGLGKLHYASNVTFNSGNNTPYSNNSSNIIKNYTTATDNEWYKVKTKTSTGQTAIAKYADGNIIRVGDKMKISTLLSSDYVLDIYDGEFVTQSNVQIYTSNDTEAQWFTFLASALEDYYNIVPYAAPTLSFNIVDPRVSGANIVLASNSDVEDTRYELIDYDSTEGNYYLNTIYNIYLDVDGEVAANYQNVQVYTPDGTDSQKWKIERVE